MPTDPKTLMPTLRLLKSARLSNTPEDAASLSEYLEALLLIYPSAEPADWRAAAVGHMQDPARGSWWPTPADLGRHMPAGVAADLTDEQAFEHAVAATQRWGQHLSESERAAYRRALYGDRGLNEAQARALGIVGGTTALRSADGATLALLRKRFLVACSLPECGERVRATHPARPEIEAPAPRLLPAPVPEADAVEQLAVKVGQGREPKRPLVRPSLRVLPADPERMDQAEVELARMKRR